MWRLRREMFCSCDRRCSAVPFVRSDVVPPFPAADNGGPVHNPRLRQDIPGVQTSSVSNLRCGSQEGRSKITFCKPRTPWKSNS
jgi:hypothetical protein